MPSPFDPKSVSIYILAGGKSSRFGEDKASYIYNGKALIAYVRDTFISIKRPKVVAKAPRQFTEFNLQTIHDMMGDGPLSGLHAALNDTEDEWILLVPCDTLGFNINWLKPFEGSEKKAIAFHDSKRWLPLFSAFHKDALPIVTKNLQNENTSLWRLLDALDAEKIMIPNDWEELHRIDYKKDL